MNRTDTSTGHEGNNSLPGHWEVDRNGVSLLHTVGLEDVGKTARLAEELAIADLSAFVGLIGFVDDSGLWYMFSKSLISSNENEPCQGSGKPSDQHSCKRR